MTSYEEDLVLSGRAEDLPRVLDFIETACGRAGVDRKAWFDLQLATEEACANVIEHAYEAAGGECRLRFTARCRDVYITLQDHGRPFDPEMVTRADLEMPLEARPSGGLGLHLMHKLMDEVRFDFSPTEGNTLIMVKRDVIARPDADA